MDLKEKNTLIILSNGLTKKNNLPFFVKNKLDYAYRMYHHDTVSKIILSGKWSYLYEHTPLFNEAIKMEQYLIHLGVPKKIIFKEELSQDMLSSVYYIKKNFLIPKKWFSAVVLGSDFEEERLKFIFHKLFGKKFHFHFILVPSQLKAEILWNFFTYEKRALVSTKTSLQKMKIGDDGFLKHFFFNSALYKRKVVGYIRLAVHEGRINKKRTAIAHYSLARILNKQKEIFSKFKILQSRKKTLSADFWSGRFINFLGKDGSKSLFALKFVLYLKDRKTFINEIKVSEKFIKEGVSFIPTVISKNFDKAPHWYMYRVVDGKISGSFSTTFSFSENMMSKSFTTSQFANHLKDLRSVKVGTLSIQKWVGATYRRKIKQIYNKIQTYRKIKDNKAIKEAYEFIIRKSLILDHVTLYPTHADLHPANIIVSTKKLYFIDFEHVCQNNIAFDFCFGYVFAWNDKSYQDDILIKFKQSLSAKEEKEFDLIFPIVLLYFYLWLLRFTYLWENRAEKQSLTLARSEIKKEISRIIENYK